MNTKTVTHYKITLSYTYEHLCKKLKAVRNNQMIRITLNLK